MSDRSLLEDAAKARKGWPKGKPRPSCSQDLSGRTFNLLTVQSRAENRGDKRAYWNCLCICGQSTIANSHDLKSGHTKSCGCWNIHTRKVKATTHGHGSSRKEKRNKTYLAWLNMRRRCSVPTAKGYMNYGGRGIKVCDAWHDFESFLRDMGEAPAGMSLERLDVNGNYEPGNCTWASLEDQSNNKRTTVFVELDGTRLSLSQAARAIGCSPGRVRYAAKKHGANWLQHVRAAAAISTGRDG